MLKAHIRENNKTDEWNEVVRGLMLVFASVNNPTFPFRLPPPPLQGGISKTCDDFGPHYAKAQKCMTS